MAIPSRLAAMPTVKHLCGLPRLLAALAIRSWGAAAWGRSPRSVYTLPAARAGLALGSLARDRDLQHSGRLMSD